jgi:hypothetical protein
MKGLWTTVTNAANGKSYFVSTVRSARKGFHETAVFRKIFGPFANFWRPQATFFGEDAASLHANATELVRDFDPEYWRIFDGRRFDFADAHSQAARAGQSSRAG